MKRYDGRGEVEGMDGKSESEMRKMVKVKWQSDRRDEVKCMGKVDQNGMNG